MLGELPLADGSFFIGGTVSYYCQSPWIFPGTIRQNILFTEDFEKSRYDRVVEACALDRDFNVLPDEDFTVVGEKGVNLSGGQKARIALARLVKNLAGGVLHLFFFELITKLLVVLERCISARTFICWTILFRRWIAESVREFSTNASWVS